MSNHIHDDDRLTFACPGCIDKVKADQFAAALAEQPDRPLTVNWATELQAGTYTLQVKYLDNEQPRDVADRNIHLLPVAAEIQEVFFGKR